MGCDRGDQTVELYLIATRADKVSEGLYVSEWPLDVMEPKFGIRMWSVNWVLVYYLFHLVNYVEPINIWGRIHQNKHWIVLAVFYDPNSVLIISFWHFDSHHTGGKTRDKSETQRSWSMESVKLKTRLIQVHYARSPLLTLCVSLDRLCKSSKDVAATADISVSVCFKPRTASKEA